MIHRTNVYKRSSNKYILFRQIELFLIAILVTFVSVLSLQIFSKSASSIDYHELTYSDVNISSSGYITSYKNKGNYEHISIPEYINGNRIIGISNGAFENDKNLKSVKAPYIQYIEGSDPGAFEWCANLTSVYMPNVIRLEMFAFYSCKKLTSVVDELDSAGNIPSDVGVKLGKLTYMNGGAFAGTNHEGCPIKGFEAPNLTEIGDRQGGNCWGALEGCSKLKRVYTPKLKKIGEEAFELCVGLDDLTVGNVTSFHGTGDGDSFLSHKNIKKLTICFSDSGIPTNRVDPSEKVENLINTFKSSLETLVLKGLGSIKSYVILKGFPNLKYIEFPDLTTTSNSTGSFVEDCPSLCSFKAPKLSYFDHSNGQTFKNCPNLSDLTVGSISSASQSVLDGLNNLRNLTMTDTTLSSEHAAYKKFSTINCPNLKTINGSVFKDCTKLTSFMSPNLQTVGASAFSGCNNLTSLSFNNLTNIGDSSFSGCSKLNSFVSPKVQTIGTDAFSGCSNLTSLNFSNLSSIGNRAFNGCGKLSSLVVGNVTSCAPTPIVSTSLSTLQIAAETLDYNEGATNNFYKEFSTINCPNLKTINGSVFKDCTKLTSFTSPNLQTVGASAFSGCNNLTSLSSNNLTNIGDSSFSGCSKLVGFNAPKLQSIGDSALANCSKIESLTFDNLVFAGKNAFQGCTKLSKFKAPKITSISEESFKNCVALENVITPQAVYIGNNSFQGCTELEQIAKITDKTGNAGQGIIISRLAKNADFSGAHSGVPADNSIIPAYSGMGISDKDVVKSEGDIVDSSVEDIKLSDEEFNKFKEDMILASVYCNGDNEVISTFKNEADVIKQKIKETDKSLGDDFKFDYISKYYADYTNNTKGDDRYVVVRIQENGKPDKIKIISWTQNFNVILSKKDFFYNGESQKPDLSEISVQYGEDGSVSNDKYEISFPEDDEIIDAGTKKINVLVKEGQYGNIKVEKDNELTYALNYYIKQKEINNSSNINITIDSQTNFDGEKWDLKLKVVDNDISSEDRKNLEEGKDYTIESILKSGDESPVSKIETAGQYKVSLKFVGNYTGIKSENITIKKLNSNELNVSQKNIHTYNGQNVNNLEFNVSDEARGSEQISYKIVNRPDQMVDAGSHNITLEFDNYENKDVIFKIDPVNADNLTINADVSSIVYNGKEWTPSFEVTYDTDGTDLTLKKGVDYEIELDSDMINAGDKTIIFKFKGNYTGIKNEILKIEKANSEELVITVKETDHTPGDNSWKPDFVVKNGGNVLLEGEDYTINWPDFSTVGEKNVEFEFKNYEGKRYEKITISQIDVTNLDLVINVNESNHEYDGNIFSPQFTVKKGEEILSSESDYDVILPEDMVNVGEKVIVFRFKGVYTGELKKVLFISGTREGWGKIVINSGVINYIHDDGTTSAEIKGNEKTWLKEESDGTNAWYCIDNSDGVFEQGSKFSVKWLKENENPSLYKKEWGKLDESYKKNVKKNKSEIFLLTVTSPEGELYTNLSKSVKCYVQIGEDWSKDDIRARFLSSSEDEIVEANFQRINSPEGKKEFACLTLKHLSPYLVYEHSDVESNDDSSDSIETNRNNNLNDSKSISNPKTNVNSINIIKTSAILLTFTFIAYITFKHQVRR